MEKLNYYTILQYYNTHEKFANNNNTQILHFVAKRKKNGETKVLYDITIL